MPADEWPAGLDDDAKRTENERRSALTALLVAQKILPLIWSTVAWELRRARSEASMIDDLGQSAATAVWAHLWRSDTEPVRDLRAYARRVAHNMCTDWLMEQTAEPRSLSLDDVDEPEDEHAREPLIGSGEPFFDPMAVLTARLALLPAHERSAVEIVGLGGLSLREAGNLLNCNHETVQRWLTNARWFFADSAASAMDSES